MKISQPWEDAVCRSAGLLMSNMSRKVQLFIQHAAILRTEMHFVYCETVPISHGRFDSVELLSFQGNIMSTWSWPGFLRGIDLAVGELPEGGLKPPISGLWDDGPGEPFGLDSFEYLDVRRRWYGT